MARRDHQNLSPEMSRLIIAMEELERPDLDTLAERLGMPKKKVIDLVNEARRLGYIRMETPEFSCRFCGCTEMGRCREGCEWVTVRDSPESIACGRCVPSFAFDPDIPIRKLEQLVEALSPDDSTDATSRRIGMVLLAALVKGQDPEEISRYTGLDRGFVDSVAVKLTASGVWAENRTTVNYFGGSFGVLDFRTSILAGRGLTVKARAGESALGWFLTDEGKADVRAISASQARSSRRTGPARRNGKKRRQTRSARRAGRGRRQ